MPVLDHHGATAVAWAEVTDDAALSAGDAAIISLTRFAIEGEALLARGVRLGVILPSDIDLAAIAAIAPRLALVGVRFANMKDGRPFSVGRLLRVRYGFTGDLRSFGRFIPDQGRFLVRSGFTSFDLVEEFDVAALRGILARYPLAYQRTAADQRSIVALRHGAAAQVAALEARYAGVDTPTLLRGVIQNEFPGAIALTSSFGAESAVLLHMIAAIDPATPVLSLDTGKLFGETQRYRRALTEQLGLTNVLAVAPDAAALSTRDPSGALWASSADSCCALRKVEPLSRALAPFSAWITGRKAFHGGERSALPLFEADGGRIKINPLATWTEQDIAAYFDRHGLPQHSLLQDGYRSIGCVPCTSRVGLDEDVRAGRWRGSEKTECGIHQNKLLQAAS